MDKQSRKFSKKYPCKNLILTGFMGTGKTTIGRLLASRLNYAFIDTDDLIVERAGKSISEIFAAEAEAGFRKREKEVIRQLQGAQGLVIATGGGAIIAEQNLQALKKLGPVLCLGASERAVYRRLKGNQDRPLLKVERPLEKIRELQRLRTPYYQKADKIFDTTGKSPQKVVREIIIYLDLK